MDVVFLVGRIAYALVFIASGLTAHRGRMGIEYARGYGAPAPELLVPLSGAVIVAGGAMIALGLWGDVGALLVFGFLVSITPIMHAFWTERDEQTRAMQQAMFTKNLALAGAALVVFYVFNQLQGDVGLCLTDPVFGRG